MSQQRLPVLTSLKPTPANFDVAIIMSNHKKKINELKQKKSTSNMNTTITYRDLIHENPKRNYFLQTKYTQIQRQNRLLFQKISGLSKNKRKQTSLSHNHFGTLNLTFRKQQIQDIERQNVKMFGRIQKQKASISFRQTDKQYSKNKEISQRLSNLQKNKLHDWYA